MITMISFDPKAPVRADLDMTILASAAQRVYVRIGDVTLGIDTDQAAAMHSALANVLHELEVVA
jgi:hypothetical protein